MQIRQSTTDKKLVIAVIGGNQCTPEEAIKAETVGRELARQGVILVCGGLGGIMEAVCRGASIEGGITVGILPGIDPSSANNYVRIPVATGLGEARNVAVVRTACAVIAIDGDYGTLSEIAFALKYGIPVIGLNTWKLIKNNMEINAIIEANDAVDAVQKAIMLGQNYLRKQI